MTALAEAQGRIAGWRNDAVAFTRENFGVEPDAWQNAALSSLRPDRVNRLCMKACAGPGKSAVLAWAGWWFLSCFAREGEHPKGAAVSITEDNLRDNLWPEFSKWQERSQFLSRAFVWQSERIFAKDHPRTWFLSARSFAKTANAEQMGRTLSGLHSEFPFVLLDESGDMNPALGRAAEQAMGGEGVRAGLLAQAGNTTSMTGLLYHSAVSDASNWNVVTITADPDDPNRTPRVKAEWAAEQIRKYGRDNPWVMAYVLGQFPPAGMNALIGVSEVEECMRRVLPLGAVDGQARLIGVDPARFGDDPTVIIERQGRCAFNPEIMRGARTNEIADRVAYMNRENPADAVFVDATGGYGGGVIDALRLTGIRVIEVNFSSKANDESFYNKRAEIWWDMTQWCKSGGKLPTSAPEIVRELCETTYAYKGSRILLEDKDQIKARLGWSPNIADALATTFAIPIQAASRLAGIKGPTAQRQPYDPLAGVRGYVR